LSDVTTLLLIFNSPSSPIAATMANAMTTVQGVIQSVAAAPGGVVLICVYEAGAGGKNM